MDGPRFDTLTRAITSSRRNSFKPIFGGLLGAVLIGRGGEEAAAGCKKVGRNCDKNKDCCNGAECKGGECKCKSGRDECNGKCFDLGNDENHCGDCNTTCGAGETCCDGECVALDSDRDNCTSCGAACAGDEICFEGACLPCPIGNQVCGDVCCPPFETCCDGTCVGELHDNPDHCGECGNRCPGICSEDSNGIPICHGPRCCSNGHCIKDVQSNRNHCGGCNNACAPNEACCEGECGNTCGNTFCACDETCCDGECADLERDDDHCGRCDVQCVPGHVCTEGRCKPETPGN